jgi:uncharacterized protein YkwD
MLRAFIVSVALVLSGSASAGNPPSKPPRVVGVDSAALVQPSPEYDKQAEQQLLDLANSARSQAGVPPLQNDRGLVEAARAHAAEMAAQQQLSHQFPGEPALTQRLAQGTVLHLDFAGENVALAAEVDRVQDLLMHSTPHRANLLNPVFNVAGIGVVRMGDVLYVAQDFGHALPTYSGIEAGQLISAALQRARTQHNLTAISLRDSAETQQVACAMAQANSLQGPPSHARIVLRYTAARPDNLPNAADQALSDPALRSFSVGSCYARTPAYVNGAYFVVVYFY